MSKHAGKRKAAAKAEAEAASGMPAARKTPAASSPAPAAAPSEEPSDDGADHPVFDEDEDEEDVPGERPQEDHWYELVEAKLAALPRAEGHDRRTWAGVFDKRTMMTLYRFLSNDLIASLDFPIATGKEADVFRATTPEGTFVCVKIYRTNTATFHDVLQYIQGDPRFSGIKRDKRGLVAAWAQKEYRNLMRAVDVGVRVPAPVKCLDNILMMEYIGTAVGPYAQLKDVAIADPPAVANAILDDYRRLLVDGRLVHADLSEYNILWTGTEHVIIDVGQAVLLEHPMAEEFLERDVKNLARFLKRFGARTNADAVRRHVLGDFPNFSALLEATREDDEDEPSDDGSDDDQDGSDEEASDDEEDVADARAR